MSKKRFPDSRLTSFVIKSFKISFVYWRLTFQFRGVLLTQIFFERKSDGPHIPHALKICLFSHSENLKKPHHLTLKPDGQNSYCSKGWEELCTLKFISVKVTHIWFMQGCLLEHYQLHKILQGNKTHQINTAACNLIFFKAYIRGYFIWWEIK